MGNPVIVWRLLVSCVLVSYFCCNNVRVLAMPHHEPGHLIQESSDIPGHDPITTTGHHRHLTTTFPDDDNPISEIVAVESPHTSSSLPTSIATTNNETNGTTDIIHPAVAAMADNTETTAQTTTTSESESTPTITSTAVAAGGGTMVDTTKATTTTIGATADTEFIPNEISRAVSSSPSGVGEQQEGGNVVEDAGGTAAEFSLNSIPPTILAVLATAEVLPPSSSQQQSLLPLLPPPPTVVVTPPVIDPISFQHKDSDDDDHDESSVVGDNGVSSTSTTYLALPNLPFIVPGASSPSIQLIPPPPTTPTSSLSSPDIPQEPDQGELPESPEPHSHHPFNLRDIPISLVSLSGNSGGSTSDMATFTSFASPTDNVPVDYTQFRYHVVTGQLFKIGSTGPGICPKNMRFFAVPGHPKNGACDCDYYQCSRPLIYSPEAHQCFWAWSQGPCDKGEWFVFDKDLRRRGKCDKNPCPSLSSSSTSNDTTSAQDYYFQSPEDEACYQAGTQGYCGDADERLLIYPGEPIPTCRKFTLCYPLTVPQELQCIYGNKYFVESGHCQ